MQGRVKKYQLNENITYVACKYDAWKRACWPYYHMEVYQYVCVHVLCTFLCMFIFESAWQRSLRCIDEHHLIFMNCCVCVSWLRSKGSQFSMVWGKNRLYYIFIFFIKQLFHHTQLRAELLPFHALLVTQFSLCFTIFSPCFTLPVWFPLITHTYTHICMSTHTHRRAKHAIFLELFYFS